MRNGEDEKGAGRAVCAAVVVTFLGRRFSFRRGIWPPAHPASTSAGIYATVLEGRLPARPRPPLTPGTDTAIEPPVEL